MPEITEVDGVRAVVGNEPGPLRAGLLLRVGTADEPAARSGVTHLLEHLALFGLGRPGEHSNGSTGQTMTTFHTVGTPEEVTGFLGALTRQLAAPPVERLDDERAVLEAERARRSAALEDRILLWRYGSRDYGVSGLGEIGLPAVGPDVLRAWSARFATRGNAVLWFSAPPPAGLRIELPDGGFQPPPDPTVSMLPQLPAWFSAGESLVGAHLVVPRGYASLALADVLGDRLIDELRTRRAIAYAPASDYLALTGEHARLLVATDVAKEKMSDGVRLFLATLQQVAAENPVTEEELVAWRARYVRDRDVPHAGLGWVVATAENVLMGLSPDGPEQAYAAVASLTVEDVQAVARTAAASAVAGVPGGVRVAREPWVLAPGTLPVDPVSGVRHPHLSGEDRAVEVGDAGLTMTSGDSALTVRRETASAVLRWPDGRRQLLLADGGMLVVEPTQWRDGGRIVAAVDALFPRELWVDQPPRRPDEIPKTPVPPAAPVAAPAGPPVTATSMDRTNWIIIGYVVLTLVIWGVGVAIASVLGDGPAAEAVSSASLIAGVTTLVSGLVTARRASQANRSGRSGEKR